MRILGVGLALVSTALSVGVGMGSAQAGPPDGAATVVKGADCMIRMDPQGTLFFETTDMQAVITPSGQVNLVCHGQAPAGTVAPFVQRGFPCFVGPAGITTNSHVVWNAAGKGTVTCHGRI
jgi:hypothetical protein